MSDPEIANISVELQKIIRLLVFSIDKYILFVGSLTYNSQLFVVPLNPPLIDKVCCIKGEIAAKIWILFFE